MAEQIPLNALKYRVEIELALRGKTAACFARERNLAQSHISAVVRGERASEPVWRALIEEIGSDPRHRLTPGALRFIHDILKYRSPHKALDMGAAPE